MFHSFIHTNIQSHILLLKVFTLLCDWLKSAVTHSKQQSKKLGKRLYLSISEKTEHTIQKSLQNCRSTLRSYHKSTVFIFLNIFGTLQISSILHNASFPPIPERIPPAARYLWTNKKVYFKVSLRANSPSVSSRQFRVFLAAKCSGHHKQEARTSREEWQERSIQSSKAQRSCFTMGGLLKLTTRVRILRVRRHTAPARKGTSRNNIQNVHN